MEMGTPAPPGATAPPDPVVAAAAAAGPVAHVTMVDDRFVPNDLAVTVGTTVVWTNNGQNWHSVASFDGSFASGRVSPGESYAHRFDVPGAYQYLCKHHGLQGMAGRITVA
jgi:plastocyanin